MNTDANEAIKNAGNLINKARQEISRRVVGQTELIDGLLTGIIAKGHVLVEGVPGLAKTLAVKALADISDAEFKRIQFTPDLLPADLTGTMIYRQQTGEFVAKKGPIFSNVILADEINRAPAKVQAALLEAMAERQVTIDAQTYSLPEPFFVMATQNPIEQEGTYRLPEAQLDRFLLKILVKYPTPTEELSILELMENEPIIPVRKVLNYRDIKQLRSAAEQVKAEEAIRRYIVSIVAASRTRDQKQLAISRYIEYGASPRATLAIFRSARVHALYESRSFVLPDDVKIVAPMVLRHRIVLSYEAEAEDLNADDVIDTLLSSVSVP